MSSDLVEKWNLLSAATSVSTGTGYQAPIKTKRTFQAHGTTSSGAGAATILVQGSNVDTDANYITIGTITLTLGTTSTSDGFATDAPWAFVRGKVSAISGTGASVNLVMGV